MDPRTTTRAADRAATSGRHGRSRRRPPAPGRRPGLYLSVAAAGALLVNVLVGTEPTAQAEAGTSESVSVAAELGLSAQSRGADPTADIEALEQLAASRSSREAEETAAQQAQAAADQAERDRQKAEAEAAARAAAEAAAAEAAAAEKAAAEEEAAAAASGTSVSQIAQITNSAGPIRDVAQAAANAVVSNVRGAAGITIGGTRASAADPGGHPSGLALDYMVMSDVALGEAIVEYHIANWDALGVDYLIYRQRYLSSPGGSWEYMEDRGSATANHMDHPHVTYRG